MSKKTLALIIFLFIITCGLLYLAIVTPPYKKQPTPTSPSPTPISVNAHTMLSLTQASASESSKTAPYTLSVLIDSGENVVNAVQLELAYDPQAITNVILTPGTFFQQPTALLNNINAVDGRISYALAEQIDISGKKGKGTLAYISFTVQPTFSGKTTTFTFLPKTAVAADKVLESVLKKAIGYTLTVTKPSLTPSSALPLGTQSAK